MGQVNAVPSFEQRGRAAQVRQLDDNNGGHGQLIGLGNRRFTNTIIHDPNMNYSPEYEPRLSNLFNNLFPPGRN